MEKERKITGSAYQKIAIEIAQSVASGKYTEGQKLFGRSSLAAQFSVSPETIRKAVHLLKDVGVLDSEKGSGIHVLSKGKALEFVQRHKEAEEISKLKEEVLSSVKRQMAESKVLTDKVQMLVESTERFKNTSYFTPYEMKITSDTTVIGKTLAELNFWHNTEGTVIAITREEKIILSPGPYATFMENDIFHVIGSEQSYYAVQKLLFQQ